MMMMDGVMLGIKGCWAVVMGNVYILGLKAYRSQIVEFEVFLKRFYFSSNDYPEYPV